ncbi:hypothetical protein CSKR_110678 [Clonorchis sinensis]|uniref:Uncharacterized protein n=1 Tax=Clonorchis sinensis TaxID=79923 RepID=A0A3R7D1J1_CLOSI|nr:hypothetical protein CSKR_110678 [Clonorchis sinensis]
MLRMPNRRVLDDVYCRCLFHDGANREMDNSRLAQCPELPSSCFSRTNKLEKHLICVHATGLLGQSLRCSTFCTTPNPPCSPPQGAYQHASKYLEENGFLSTECAAPGRLMFHQLVRYSGCRGTRIDAQSPSFGQNYVLLEPKLRGIREIHSFSNKLGFARDSPGTQLNVLGESSVKAKLLCK